MGSVERDLFKGVVLHDCEQAGKSEVERRPAEGVSGADAAFLRQNFCFSEKPQFFS